MEVNKCDCCGSTQIRGDVCEDKNCYWYSHWTPAQGMSKEDAKNHEADIDEMNWQGESIR